MGLNSSFSVTMPATIILNAFLSCMEDWMEVNRINAGSCQLMLQLLIQIHAHTQVMQIMTFSNHQTLEQKQTQKRENVLIFSFTLKHSLKLMNAKQLPRRAHVQEKNVVGEKWDQFLNNTINGIHQLISLSVQMNMDNLTLLQNHGRLNSTESFLISSCSRLETLQNGW